jgi:hypothetical protein
MPGYANTGPFTNNVTPPGISATFLNNIENFLDTITSVAYDSHVSSDGSGNVTVASLKLANGQIHAIAWGFISACTFNGTTVTHGLGGTPGVVFGQVGAGTGNTGAVVAYVSSLGSTTFVMATNSASNFPVYWIAFR